MFFSAKEPELTNTTMECLTGDQPQCKLNCRKNNEVLVQNIVSKMTQEIRKQQTKLGYMCQKSARVEEILMRTNLIFFSI